MAEPSETTAPEQRRQDVEAWASSDPKMLSALYVKAEEALERTRRLLLDVEGSLLAYWTDLPQSECERLRVKIRDELGDYEPGQPPSFAAAVPAERKT